MSRHHVLILGGHGKIAQLLTPLLLQRSWTVTSLIRTESQKATVEKLGCDFPGKLNVLVRSIADVDSQDGARCILDEVQPDYVVWSAGAGGKGGKEMTFRVDRDAAIHFIHAAASMPSISRFLLVSYTGSRRSGASWWRAGEWDEYNQKVNQGVLADYYRAKIVADEVLYTTTSRKDSSLVGLCLRPGTLSDGPAGGIEFGKTKHVMGQVSRISVARTAAALLAADGVKTSWLDLLDGDEDVDAAVGRAVRDGLDAAEGEKVHAP